MWSCSRPKSFRDLRKEDIHPSCSVPSLQIEMHRESRRRNHHRSSHYDVARYYYDSPFPTPWAQLLSPGFPPMDHNHPESSQLKLGGLMMVLVVRSIFQGGKFPLGTAGCWVKANIGVQYWKKLRLIGKRELFFLTPPNIWWLGALVLNWVAVIISLSWIRVDKDDATLVQAI